LVFVGDGEDRKKIEASVNALGLSHVVRITGCQPPEEVRAYLNAADVVAVPSEHEGWSIAMLEALACGKAIVSTDVSGSRDMIRPGQNGFIVESRDARRFSEFILQAGALRNASSISRQIGEQYSVTALRNDVGKLWPPLA
jgi:glycosyltransferase involved in cell wall biosynthesis